MNKTKNMNTTETQTVTTKKIQVAGVEFRVLSGAPIPDRKWKTGKWSGLYAAMTIGQAVDVANDNEAKALYQTARNAGGGVVCRKVGQLVRVWKTA
jgi:hypothetical protein